MNDGEAKSLLGLLGPGETLTAPTLANASFKVPFWLNWIEPVIVDVIGRARYFMYKEGKKSKLNEFSVTYTNKTIRKGFIRELERTRLLKNIQMDFFSDEFSFFCQAVGVSIAARGVLSVPAGGGDRLLLHLKWLKVGSVKLPENALRAIENLSAKAYVQSGNFSNQLLQITFKENAMIMNFRKTGGSDTGFPD